MKDKDSQMIQEAYREIREAQFTSSGIKKTWGTDRDQDYIEDETVTVDGIEYKISSDYKKEHKYDTGTESNPSYSEVYVTLIDPTITYESGNGDIINITPELYQKIKDKAERDMEEYEEYLLN